MAAMQQDNSRYPEIANEHSPTRTKLSICVGTDASLAMDYWNKIKNQGYNHNGHTLDSLAPLFSEILILHL